MGSKFNYLFSLYGVVIFIPLLFQYFYTIRHRPECFILLLGPLGILFFGLIDRYEFLVLSTGTILSLFLFHLNVTPYSPIKALFLPGVFVSLIALGIWAASHFWGQSLVLLSLVGSIFFTNYLAYKNRLKHRLLFRFYFLFTIFFFIGSVFLFYWRSWTIFNFLGSLFILSSFIFYYQVILVFMAMSFFDYRLREGS